MGEKCIVLWTYKGLTPAEISCNEGEILSLISKATDEWWDVTADDGRRGFIPCSYVKLGTKKESSSKGSARDAKTALFKHHRSLKTLAVNRFEDIMTELEWAGKNADMVAVFVELSDHFHMTNIAICDRLNFSNLSRKRLQQQNDLISAYINFTNCLFKIMKFRRTGSTFQSPRLMSDLKESSAELSKAFQSCKVLEESKSDIKNLNKVEMDHTLQWAAFAESVEMLMTQFSERFFANTPSVNCKESLGSYRKTLFLVQGLLGPYPRPSVVEFEATEKKLSTAIRMYTERPNDIIYNQILNCRVISDCPVLDCASLLMKMLKSSGEMLIWIQDSGAFRAGSQRRAAPIAPKPRGTVSAVSRAPPPEIPGRPKAETVSAGALRRDLPAPLPPNPNSSCPGGVAPKMPPRGQPRLQKSTFAGDRSAAPQPPGSRGRNGPAAPSYPKHPVSVPSPAPGPAPARSARPFPAATPPKPGGPRPGSRSPPPPMPPRGADAQAPAPTTSSEGRTTLRQSMPPPMPSRPGGGKGQVGGVAMRASVGPRQIPPAMPRRPRVADDMSVGRSNRLPDSTAVCRAQDDGRQGGRRSGAGSFVNNKHLREEYSAEQIEIAQRVIRRYLRSRRLYKVIIEYQRHDAAQMERLRVRSLKEILTTEETYVKNLQICEDAVFANLRISSHANQSLSQREIDIVCQNWPLILTLHQQFLASLKKYFEEWPSVTTQLGELFLSFAPKICKLYKKYVAGFDEAAEKIAELEKRETLQFEMNRIQQSLVNEYKIQLSIQSFLIMPVQRLPRYELLLRELCKLTLEDHVDHQSLTRAYETLKDLNKDVNQWKKLEENRRLISLYQRSTSNMPKNFLLTTPGRMLLREADLKCAFETNDGSSTHHCILFNDLFLVIKGKGKMKAEGVSEKNIPANQQLYKYKAHANFVDSNYSYSVAMAQPKSGSESRRRTQSNLSMQLELRPVSLALEHPKKGGARRPPMPVGGPQRLPGLASASDLNNQKKHLNTGESPKNPSGGGGSGSKIGIPGAPPTLFIACENPQEMMEWAQELDNVIKVARQNVPLPAQQAGKGKRRIMMASGGAATFS